MYVVFAGLDLEMIGSRAEEIFGGRYIAVILFFECLIFTYLMIPSCSDYVLIEITFKQFSQITVIFFTEVYELDVITGGPASRIVTYL